MAKEFMNVEVGSRVVDVFLNQRGVSVSGAMVLSYEAGEGPDRENAVSMALYSSATGLITPNNVPGPNQLDVIATSAGGGTGQAEFRFGRVKLSQMERLFLFVSGFWKEIDL